MRRSSTMQEAFPELGDGVEFVADAVAEDGTASTRAAAEPEVYKACFRLADPNTCEWADGGTDDIWVTWSIEASYYDPNSKEISYWGTAYNNTTISVAYSGEPVWIRPWFKQAADGEYPDWVTHWGSAGRPTNDRRSAVVVYQKGSEDYEGLVGYHQNANGTLEPVTGAQVCAWMCGVDVDGKHVDVESGDKVWYKLDDGDDLTVLAVQSEEPAGADGCVVARDLAYVDKLGVMDVGRYHAYALFSEDAGYVAVSAAEADVTVTAANSSGSGSTDATPASTTTRITTAKTGSTSTSTSQKSSASLPKTGDPTLCVGVPGLLGALSLALALARRRRS